MAELEGTTLHADSKVPGGDPFALERLSRYVTRPPVASERLSLAADGKVVYRLRTPFHGGTSMLSFHPLAFIARLAAPVPPPRFHLVTYHRVLAPNHALHSRVVPRKPRRRRRKGATPPRPACGRHPWADLLKKGRCLRRPELKTAVARASRSSRPSPSTRSSRRSSRLSIFPENRPSSTLLFSDPLLF
ncbi:MAG: transposase [Planctomycetota bacterium]